MLLHGFQQCGLGLGGCTVDFVRQDDVGEHRAGLELEGGVAVFVLNDDVGTGNVGGHQVGGELNTGEGQVEYPAQGADQTGLTNAGHAFQQYVTAGDHGDDRALDNIFLTDHVALDLRKNVLALLAELLNVLFCNCHNDTAPLVRCVEIKKYCPCMLPLFSG